MFSLIIKGGRVIDPAQNIDGKLDVAINGDKIAKVAKDIPPQEGQQVLEAKGKIVTPGIIDVHCHISGGIHSGGIDPDVAGVSQGVTTVVDGGSTGAYIFVGFPRFVIPASKSRVFCFLHICALGLTIMPELRDQEEINLKATAATIDANREVIKGVKLRLVGNLVAREGIKVVQTAQDMAKQFGMPLMIHIGDYKQQVSPTLTREMLPLLRSGDILDHIYTPLYGGALRADDKVLPELREAMERGVVMDAAMGTQNFSFRVARKIIDQGILPTTISTDLTIASTKRLIYGMTVTMSKFLALGLELKQVIEMSTINPARALGEEKRIGSLKPGMEADVSILELLSGKWKLEDTERQTIDADRLLVPRVAVKGGQVIPSHPVGQPQPVE